MCAIEMVNLPFVINLTFSRAVEGKNILKLPRPTLQQSFPYSISSAVGCFPSHREQKSGESLEARRVDNVQLFAPGSRSEPTGEAVNSRIRRRAPPTTKLPL